MPRLNTNDGRLKGAQYEEFQLGILDAYAVPAFQQMLLFRLERNLANITSVVKPFPEMVLDVILAADDESWTANLLQGARASRPDNEKLLAFARQFGLASGSRQLELTIKQRNPMLNVVQWRQGLGQAEGRVCRVEVRTGSTVDPLGTGFLLGSNVVVTNYHVVKPVIDGVVAPERIVLRFDYKALADGLTINPGVEYPLAAAPDWKIDASEYSPIDLLANSVDLPAPTQLDYALLRVDGAPGTDPITGGTSPEPMAVKRGWITIPQDAYAFPPQSALSILQHPAGEPLKLALDFDAVLTVNANRTRVRYTTNTAPGSSGSPCFDANWNLVALHHSGDPKYPALKKAEYNQGIPFSTIVSLLAQHGKESELGV